MRRGWLGGSIAAAACAACSLVTDLGGYAGGGGVDASVVADAGADGTSPERDGSVPALDGGTDAGPFCVKGAHFFCSDFEQGNILADGWTNAGPNGAQASLGIATDKSVSAPGSMLAGMQRRSDSDPLEYATAVKDIGSIRRIVVEYDMFAVEPAWLASDINSGIFVIGMYPDAGVAKDITLSYGDGYTTLGTPGSPASGGPLPSNKWIHVKASIDPAGHIDASFGTVAFSQDFPAVVGPGKMTLELGIHGYNRPAPEFRVYYDNVTIDLP